jgi:hypothetical protein
LRAKPARPIAGTMGVLTIRQFSLNGLVFFNVPEQRAFRPECWHAAFFAIP